MFLPVKTSIDNPTRFPILGRLSSSKLKFSVENNYFTTRNEFDKRVECSRLMDGPYMFGSQVSTGKYRDLVVNSCNIIFNFPNNHSSRLLP